MRDYPEIPEYGPDQVEVVEDNIDIGVSDDELVERVNRREKDWRGDYTKLQELAVENRNYWRGRQLDENSLYEGDVAIVVNRIFQSMETIIPIVTRRTPEPNVTVRPFNSNDLKLQEKIEAKLKESWEVDQEMQSKVEEGLRNLFCSRYMAMKYFYNEETDDYEFTLMPMGKLSFPHKASSPEECPAIIEYVSTTVGDLKERFPEKKEEIEAQLRALGANAGDDTEVDYIEYWEDDFYACVWKDLLLYKDYNPNFNYDPVPETDEEGNPIEEAKEESEYGRSFNYYRHPRKPYLFLNWLTFGDSMVDDTSLVEQVKSLQDGINRRKMQFDQNAKLANGKMIAAGNRISRDDFDNITNDPEEKLYLENADSVQGAIDMFYGRSLDSGIYNDMQDSKAEVDNIMGTHSTTRGERDAKETATGRAILKESDVGRLEILTRRIEKFGQEVYGAMIQMMYVYYTSQHPVHMLDEDNDPTKLTAKEKESYILRDEFAGKNIRVLVQAGSTTPRDKMVEKAEAIDLWQNGGMATVDMYRRLEYGDAEKLARNAFYEKNMPEMLYGGPDGQGYNVDAIRNIQRITDGKKPEPFKTQNIDRFTNYIVTFQEYMKGTEVDVDLPEFKALDRKQQAAIRTHLEEELAMVDELIAKEEEKAAQLPPEQPPVEPPMPPMPPGAPVDPAMLAMAGAAPGAGAPAGLPAMPGPMAAPPVPTM